MSNFFRFASALHAAADVLSILVGTAGVWCLWRVGALLHMLPTFEARIAALATSASLLTDATESGFKTLSVQLESLQPQGGPHRPWTETSRRPAGRGTRHRRIVSAVRRGEPVAAIASREEIAEGEVALRLQIDEGRRAAAQNRDAAPGA
jgi:hypothetical protein